MNNKGFTLVELMVVIVIVALLASIGMAKFNHATSKAKASELPAALSQIVRAEEFYRDEVNEYIDIDPDENWSTNLQTKLGVDVKSSLFIYYVTDASKAYFVARARVKTPFGDIEKETTVEAYVDVDGFKGYVGDDNGALASYTRAWYNE